MTKSRPLALTAPGSRFRRRVLTALALAVVSTGVATARDAGDPIRIVWMEGDVAGMTPILGPAGGQPIGFVEYHQHRDGDVLHLVRVSRFGDGSSDEDRAEARVDGGTLRALRGRSIIRNTAGKPVVDLTIDVEGGRLSGFTADGDERTAFDEKVDLPPGTYWGPLIFLVVKNFDQNAEQGRVVFRTVAPTPRPRVLDLEVRREADTSVRRPGGTLPVAQLTLRPTLGWLVDPIIQRLAPETHFFVHAGEPPALARFAGPRNYAGQEIRLE